ncbi:MAG: hypothetical protein IT371_23875 [Deltaproteobacteria bacterium]|nr:hypothetical protein [Deltaproteobacteria bacterium]
MTIVRTVQRRFAREQEVLARVRANSRAGLVGWLVLVAALFALLGPGHVPSGGEGPRHAAPLTATDGDAPETDDLLPPSTHSAATALLDEREAPAPIAGSARHAHQRALERPPRQFS